MSQELNTTIDDVLKVSGSTNPQSAGSILARAINTGQTPKMRAIGASAVNQAAKAACIARGFVAPRGIDLLFVMGFDDIQGENGETISAISFKPVIK